MPSLLVLLRHGQTVRNAVEEDPRCKCRLVYVDEEARRQVGIFSDRLLPLSEKGQQEARRAGTELRQNFGVFDVIFHSGFLRAQRTTELLLDAYSNEERSRIEVRENSDIRERDPGYCYNMTEAEANKFFPWFLDYWNSADPFARVPIGGESTQRLCDGRLRVFLESLKNPELSGKKVLAVSHYSAIVGLRYLIEKWSQEKANNIFRNHAGPKNCGAVAYVYDYLIGYQLLFENKVYD